MNAQTEPDLDHGDRERIYAYLKDHGPTDYESVQEATFPQDPGGFRHHVAILKRNGLVEEALGGGLQVVPELEGEEEEFTRDGVEFHVRPARQADLSGILGVLRQVAEKRTYIVAETVAQELDHERELLRQNDVESRVFFVATVNDEVVGWTHLQSPEIEKLSHTAELTTGVLEEYRGHGLGGHLLERGLEWAGSQGYERVYQSIPSTNEGAVEFLEDHNWEVEAVREGHYKIDGEYVDEVMMAVSL
ncbi:putative N-acetyltransferase [Halalkalicoccus paucihalophilus]|uniref:Putative N-acetyltransferase n=1 Tax=Halalkalicoccus paucihalophilus TaxID=1008153 RepID=A0A151AIA0_9EURY|nr:GNAT family N-acetyltransferase [Halalkalicoccus paucihalophilus]KYH27353.1 putative N-acetyltransferase [Halalkalicoccus paucihalophilus]